MLRIKKNFHLIIELSPMKSTFNKYLRMFPYLINACSIIWIDEWSNNALESVGKGQLEEYDVDLNLGNELIDSFT